MKINRLLLLLLALAALPLTSCIQTGGTTGISSSSDPGYTSGEPLSPELPVWSAAETLAAAEEMIDMPTSGIVDVSRADYSYEEMTEDLQTLALVYGEHFSYHSIGTSAAGRTLYVGVLGNPDARRQIVVSAAIHGREYMTAQLTMKQLEFYLRYYDVGSYQGIPYSELFEQICFYIVPMTNPDGVMIAQQGLESLPEELRPLIEECYETEEHDVFVTFETYLSRWKANANGVDLNRNYDARWEEYDGADHPQSYQYKGPSPASEPETQAMVALMDSLPNVIATLCVHSQGEVIYWNCGQGEDTRSTTRGFAEEVSKRNGYELIDEQNNDASLSDWSELERSVPAITVEIGKGALVLPTEQFPTVWLENYDLLPLTAAYFLSIPDEVSTAQF